ncbi:MAG: GGDEF domain-containing protein [Tagaea sp.]|nr:GGDEF domain-containing protein [Tagaea sp.]
MKITDSSRAGGLAGAAPIRRPDAPARAGAAAPVLTARARDPKDIALVMGIPEAEFTPKVREAIVKLMTEVDRLRKEVVQATARASHLERLADQDGLVPVFNRRAFLRELGRMQAFAERYDQASSLVYFDANGLKTVNDGHGHAAGDALLAHIARLLVQNVRDTDIVGRLGGDEFGVILVYTDNAQADEKAQLLARVVQDTPLDWRGVAISASVAWGVYTFRGGDDIGRLLESADREMYERKRAARTP